MHQPDLPAAQEYGAAPDLFLKTMDFLDILAQAAETAEKTGFFERIAEWFGGLFSGLWDFFKSLWTKISGSFGSASKWGIWICSWLLMLIGFLGTILPFLPGTTLILAGCWLHFLALGRTETGLTWISMAIITVLYVASVIFAHVSGALGAKWFGSSKWGVIGAIAGGIVGMFFGLPGLIIGPLAGVFAFEVLVAKKKMAEAGNSTMGTIVGGGAGAVANITFGFLMVAVYVIDLFFLK